MKIIVKFSLDIDEEYSEELYEAKEYFLQILKPYAIENSSVFGTFYKLDYYSKEYSEIIKFMEENRLKYNEDIVYVYTEFTMEFSDDEIEKAVAFIPNYRENFMEEYEDENFVYKCKQCLCRDASMKLRAKSSKRKKVLQSKETLFRIGEGIDILYGVSNITYERLVQKGMNSNNFKEVYSAKKEDKIGYIFHPTKTINVICPNYINEKCSFCGSIYANCKRETSHFPEMYYVKELPSFEKECVIASEEYYDGERLVMLSPKLYHEIKHLAKKNAFIPVFLEQDKQ